MTPRFATAMTILALAAPHSPVAAQEGDAPASDRQAAPDARTIAARATPAVVAIRAVASDEMIGTGSGFLINRRGVVVTNHHVVAEADRLEIELSTGEVFRDVYHLASNPRRDLAILQIPSTQLPFLDIGDASAVAVGDRIYVVGNPMGMDRTFTDGLVSARRVIDGVAYIQISAPISPGSSGGPVLDARGGVVGVSTGSITDGQNLNLAVPIGYAEGLLTVAPTPRPFTEVAMEWRDAGEVGPTRPAVAAEPPAEAPTESKGIAAADRPEPAPDSAPAQPARPAASLVKGAPPADSAPAPAQEEPAEELAEPEPAPAPDGQASVREQLANVTEIVADEEFVPTGDGDAGSLGSGGVESMRLTLTPGTYRAVGVCDGDCRDLNLAVLTSSNDVVERDVLPDAFPVVDFTVETSGVYHVAVQMMDCATDACYYGTILFRQ